MEQGVGQGVDSWPDELKEFVRCMLFGMAENRGRAKAIRSLIFRLTKHRGLVLSDKQQSRLSQCDNHVQLDRWFTEALDAKTADELLQ